MKYNYILLICLLMFSYVKQADAQIGLIIAAGNGVKNLASKKSIKKLDIKSIEIISDNSQPSTLGAGRQFGVKVHYEKKGKAKELNTYGYLNGDTDWKHFVVTVTGGSHAEGYIGFPKTIEDAASGEVKISVTMVDHPNISSELIIPIDHSGRQHANFSGEQGASGRDGKDAPTGHNGGTSGGGNGATGGTGGRGGKGSLGNTINVQVSKIDLNGIEVLQVDVVNAKGGNTYSYFVNTASGTLTVSAAGGEGGSGGEGGAGGDGGTVNATFSPESAPFKNLITFIAPAGDGGSVGRGGRYGDAGGRYSREGSVSPDPNYGNTGVSGSDGTNQGYAGQAGTVNVN